MMLRTAGQGVLEPVWHELLTFQLPLLAIAGARDEGYTAAAKRMAETAPRGQAAIVEEAGHATQLQRPDEVARLIEAFVAGIGATRQPNARASHVVTVLAALLVAPPAAGAAPTKARLFRLVLRRDDARRRSGHRCPRSCASACREIPPLWQPTAS